MSDNKREKGFLLKQYHDEKASKRFGSGKESVKHQSLHKRANPQNVILKAETLNLHCLCYTANLLQHPTMKPKI